MDERGAVPRLAGSQALHFHAPARKQLLLMAQIERLYKLLLYPGPLATQAFGPIHCIQKILNGFDQMADAKPGSTPLPPKKEHSNSGNVRTIRNPVTRG